mgnify:CR=1 FL=1
MADASAEFSPQQFAAMAQQQLAAGDALGAEGLARRAIAGRESPAAACLVLAQVALQRGEREPAILYFKQAAEGGSVAACIELGRLYQKNGNTVEAILWFQRAQSLQPRDAGVLAALGEGLWQLRRWESAAATYETLAALTGAVATWERWAEALWRAGNSPLAEEVVRKALATCGDCSAGLGWLAGELALARSDVEEAEAWLRKALERAPQHAESWAALGDTLIDMARAEEAMAAYRRAAALDLEGQLPARIGAIPRREQLLRGEIDKLLEAVKSDPQDPLKWFALGKALHEGRDLPGSQDCYARAVALAPDYTAALNNLGLSLVDGGDIAGGLEQLDRAAALPGGVGAAQNHLYVQHFDSRASCTQVDAAHRAWGRKYADPLRDESVPFGNPRDAKKRLRVGVVSAHLFCHSVGRFLLKPFEHWDHEAAELVCYSTAGHEDPVRARLRAGADGWRNVRNIPDEQLAAQVRDEGVDVLLDLTMHMAGSRWGLFARRAAPVQVAYLAYCSTTGMATMDYRLTDAALDPPGRRDFIEANLWLESHWCYDPGIPAPSINPLPAARRGYITFASLNNFCKVSREALETWASILREVKGSELVIQAIGGPHRERVRSLFEAAGVASSRIRFFDRLGLDHYLRMHHGIDIALDPFAYAGGTTTCDALWMGVPTISLVGDAPWRRGGRSLLPQVGLGDLAVDTPGEYAQVAIELARDRERLAALRRTLRDRMAASRLTDGRAFAQDLEGLLRRAWTRWCAR